jgi:hypothetical protein
MTAATEYRQYARECVESAREATSEPARTQFLEIAKLWLTATLAKQDPMSKAEEYRTNAAKCRQQSEAATHSEDKAL